MTTGSNNRFSKLILSAQASVPTPTPALSSGEYMLIIKTDGKLYKVDNLGNETEIAAVTSIVQDWKASVRVATTANITLSGTQTIDGVSVIAGDRVLVKNQTTGSANGIYVCASGAWSRATDADSSSEVTANMAVFVEEGTANADKIFILTTNNPITLGTTSLTFTALSTGGGGSGLAFIGEVTVSSGASLVVSSGFSATYDEYEVHFHIAPANDNVAWRIELSTDGGSTWLSSGYKWGGAVWYSNGFSTAESNNGAAIWSGGECGNASGEHVRGVIRLLNPLDTSYQKMVEIKTNEITHHPYLINRNHAMQNTTLSAVNAIRFTFASGNISDGRARLYGIAKS